MAVNKNFVVKNGLEVDTNTLFVDSANNRVAIGTTVPTAALDVRGKILSDSQVESWVGKFVGIVTAGAVGVTTLTYSVGTGSSTKLGRANAEELNVTAGFTTVQSASATDIIVSSGSTFSKDVNIGAAATITGISKFTGAAKFAANSRFEKSLAIGEDLNVGGATTVGGALTVTGNAYFNGNLDVGGDLTFDEVNARNATITGIATVGFSTSANAYIAGITTSSLLHVGMGATMVKVQGTPATRVGINSVGPAFTLDVDGDINSTGTIRQAGVSLQDTVSGDATALAIALG